MKKVYTAEQVNKKFRDRYVEFRSTYDYSTKVTTYEVVRSHKECRENTTLGQDVGTPLEYTR